MNWWQALLLGIVEGLTEYLPVSSTGHLLVTQRLLGIAESEAANAYAIVIQAGAIVAVLGLYRERVQDALLGLAGKSESGARLSKALVVAFLPAAVFGLLFDDKIESYLFGAWPVVVAWAAGGVLILAIAKKIHAREGLGLDALTWRSALLIGTIQCCAMWPGVSRSLSTILGGLVAGLALTAAVEFSFLLGLLTLGAATAYKLLDSGSVLLTEYGVVQLLIGFAAAWVSATLAVKWMVSWLTRHGMAVFGWWRLIAAAIVAGMLLTGNLSSNAPENPGGVTNDESDTPTQNGTTPAGE
jgi:undecaprenyl-diphosphatase